VGGNVCNAGACCTPETCTSLGYGCGSFSDGCGGTASCACDTANGEICYDNQCWTLIAHDDVGRYGAASAYWRGTLGSSVNFTFRGHTYNSGDLETTIRTQPFQYLKIFNRFDNEAVDITFSQNSTTFAQKMSARESLTGGAWDVYYYGWYTTVSALLGRLGPGFSYGDYPVTGLAAYGLDRHGVSGDCPFAFTSGITFTVGRHTHRCCTNEFDWYAIIR